VAIGGCDGGSYCDRGHCSAGCSIGGTTFAPGALDPGNGCRDCEPSQSATVWSDRPSGSACNDAGAVCTGGACVYGCDVGGALYGPGSGDPADVCQSCQPLVNATGFSPFTGLAPGGCDGGQTCLSGSCQVGCFIDQVYYPSAAHRPDDVSYCCAPGSSAAQWTAAFQHGDSHTFGPGLIAAGDFNGDKVPDIAVMKQHTGPITLYLNQGDAIFAEQGSYATGGGGTWLASGDLNRDGFDDLVTVEWDPYNGSSSLGVLMSLGADSGLTSVTSYSINADGGCIAYGAPVIGDLNGDQLPDVAVASSCGIVSVFLNTGDGGLSAEETFSSGAFYGAGGVALVASRTVFPDLAVFGYYTLTLLHNDGTGGFPAWSPVGTQSSPFSALASGDLNGDGLDDLAVAESSGVEVLLAIGDGGFASSVYPLNYSPAGLALRTSAGHLPDLVSTDNGGYSSSNLTLLVNQGDGRFAVAASNLPIGGPIAVADFNGDGAQDVASSLSATWTVWLYGCP
jgi:hypothetical protein